MDRVKMSFCCSMFVLKESVRPHACQSSTRSQRWNATTHRHHVNPSHWLMKKSHSKNCVRAVCSCLLLQQSTFPAWGGRQHSAEAKLSVQQLLRDFTETTRQEIKLWLTYFRQTDIIVPTNIADQVPRPHFYPLSHLSGQCPTFWITLVEKVDTSFNKSLQLTV